MSEEKSNDSFTLRHAGAKPLIPPAPAGGAKESCKNGSQQSVQIRAIFSCSPAESCLLCQTRAKDRVAEQSSQKKLGIVDGFSDIPQHSHFLPEASVLKCSFVSSVQRWGSLSRLRHSVLDEMVERDRNNKLRFSFGKLSQFWPDRSCIRLASHCKQEFPPSSLPGFARDLF